MTRTRYFTLTTCAYLLLILPITRLLGASFTDWLMLVFVCLVSLAIFARLERKRAVRSDELQQLTRMLALEQRIWTFLEKQWIGRTVWLKEDIRNAKEPEGRQVYVQAGTFGEIVALNRDERAPFTVLFPGFPHKVVMGLDKLDVPLSTGNVPAKRRASLWDRLPVRNSLLLRAQLVDDDDDDDVPEDAEAFVDEMRHFAAFDWHVWNDRYARRAYQQMRHYEN